MPHFETTITSDGDLVLNSGGTGGHCRVEGGFYAGTPVDINYDLDIKGKAKIQSIVNATNDTDKFLVSDLGEIRYRTGAQVLSDIGAASSSSLSNYLPLAGGTMSGAIDMDNNNLVDVGDFNIPSTLTIQAGGDITVAGTTTFQETTDFEANSSWTDNSRVRLGNSNDLQIYHNASNSFISDTGTGLLVISSNHLQVYNAGITEFMITAVENGAVNLYYDGSKKFETTSTGATITGGIEVSGASSRFGNSCRFTGNATFDDNSKAIFGDDGELEIYNNGTDSYIDDKGTGDLRIRSNFLKIEKYTGETMADFNDDNAVRLYYNNSQRWETTSDGAGTDGDVVETITNAGSKRIGFNASGSNFTHNSETVAHYGISNAGNSTNGGIVLSGYFGLKFATNGNIRATIQNDGDTALLSHTLVSGFEDSNSSTAYYYIPIAGSINEGTSNQYYRNFACPNSGRVVSIMMMHTTGTAVSLNSYTTQLRVVKNGSTAATSSELSASNGNNDGSYIEYLPDVDFNKGDRLGFQFSKSNSAMRWAGTSATIIIELDDYNL